MEEKKRPAVAGWLGALVVVALLCTGAFFIARGIANSRSSQLRTATPTSAFAGQAVRPLGEGIVYYDGATLHALDGKARQVWSYAAGVNAGLTVGGGGVGTWSGEVLSVLTLDQGLTLFSGSVEEDVLDARIGTIYWAVQTGKEHESTMLLLDTGGRQAMRIELKNQTVLDFGFFNNDALFWVMSLNTEGTIPLCTVTTYRPGKQLLAGTVYDNQQVLYETVFQASKIRAVGTTHIKDYDYTAKEIADNRILVYGWYLMGIDETSDNPMMAFVPIDQSDGASGISDVRLVRGQIDQRVHLPYAASKVLARGDTVYAFTGQYVMVCRLGEATPTTYALPVFVDGVLGLTENRSCVATSGGMVYLIPLP